MRYLLTGGAGFVGSHVADALVARDDDVVLLDNLSTGSRENIDHLLDSGRAEFVEGSVLDAPLVEELLIEADACFHLASSVGVKLIVEQPLDSVLEMVRGTDTVMGAAVRHGVRLLFTSTSEIYGKNGAGVLHEDANRLLGPPTTSRWAYSMAKSFGEVIAFGYARERGAETVVARLFNTVGPRQTGADGMVLPRLVRQALIGADLTVYGDGTQSRCFTHVHDAVDALLRLIDCDDAIGRVFNIGYPSEITIMELAHRVLQRTGSSSEIRLVPYEIAYEDGFEELGRRVPDCSALRELTEWEPSRTVDDAIDDVIVYQRDMLGVEATA